VVLQCVAVCCSVLQCVAVCYIVLWQFISHCPQPFRLRRELAGLRVALVLMQCIVVRVAVCYNVLQCVLQCVAVYCSACCSVLQCVL